MKRQVVKHGSSTLTVSLPSKWVKKHSIEPGMELDVLEDNTKLIISTDSIFKGLGLLSVNIPDRKAWLKRLIHIPFVSGFNEIEVITSDPEVVTLVDKWSRSMIGFEVVEKSIKRVVLKQITIVDGREFENVFTRFINLVISIGNDIIFLLEEKRIDHLKAVIEFEIDASKLNLYLRRLINLGNVPDRDSLYELYHVACLLEMISDTYRDFATYLVDNNLEVSSDIISIVREINLLIRISFNYFTGKSLNLVKIKSDLKKLKVDLKSLSNIDHEVYFYVKSLIVFVHEISTMLV